VKKSLALGTIAAAGLLVLTAAIISTRRLPSPEPLRKAEPAPVASSAAAPDFTASAQADPAQQEALLKKWADSIALAGIADAIQQTESIPDPVSRSKARAALLHSWAERDLSGALAWFAHRAGADPLQEQARDLFARAMADRDPAAMFNWMRLALPQETQSELYSPFFQRWAQKSPAAAARQLQLLADAPAANSAPDWNALLATVVAQWAQADLSQATDWVKALPNGAGKSAALRQMSDAWTAADPKGAASYAARQNDDDLLKRVAGKWAENDPRGAASWAAALPAGPRQEAAMTRIATIWAENDPAGAAAYAASLPNPRAQLSAALGVVPMWAQTAPDDTAQWVIHFPEGAVRDRAMDALIQTWAFNSASGAGQWIQNLPEGHSRDIAIAAFTGATAGSSPDAAFQLALSVSDPGLRSKQVAAAARAWLQKDPANAREAIAQANLPPGLKNDLETAPAGP